MASMEDSPLRTTANTYLPVDFLDIVATQGAYLVPRASTPVIDTAFDVEFVATLERYLEAVIIQQLCRYNMYHEDANEWPIGRTPPEVKERRIAELKKLEELEWTSDESSDNDNDDERIIRATVDPRGRVAGQARKVRSAWLPSPSLSTEDSLATSRKRKRWTISEEGDEKSSHVLKHCSSSTNTPAEDIFIPELDDLSQKCQKRRRRAADMAHDEAGTKQ